MTRAAKVAGLPFISVEQLPPALQTSKQLHVIRHILQSPADRTLSCWRRRLLYTEEAWADWAMWQPTDMTHRDANDCGRIFSDPFTMLTAPGLRSADPETAADAWDTYRRHLLITIRQALTVGVSWGDILVRMSTVYADPDSGYSRLSNYIKTALGESALLEYPLLHADVLIYNLDVSYAAGSNKYSRDSTTVDWERAISRLPGEDPISLARRVTNAFLGKHHDHTLDDVSVWSNPTFAREINNRYAECLLNDEADADRGGDSHGVFVREWRRTEALRRLDHTIPALHISCERIALMDVVTHESSRAFHELPLPPPPPEGPRPALQLTHQTGRGSRERRNEARRAEIPPSAFRTDTLPECHGPGC